METVVFHIGTHKTGSKTIQSFLRQNADSLADIYLPRSGCVDADRYANTHNIAWELLGFDLFKPELGTFQTLLSELSRVEQKVAVLSAEDFEFLSAEKIAEIAESMSGYKKVALAFLRRHDDLITSEYAHHVRTGAVTGTLEDWYAETNTDPRFDFLDLLSRWRGAGFEVKVRAYEPPPPRGDGVLRSFLRAFGLDPSAFGDASTVDSLNLRLSGKAAILTRETMAAIKSTFDIGSDAQPLADFIAWHLERLVPGNDQFDAMTDALRTRLNRRYAPMYAQIEAEYLDGATLFSPSAPSAVEFGSLDQVAPRELVAGLAGLVAVLWLQLRQRQPESKGSESFAPKSFSASDGPAARDDLHRAAKLPFN